MNLNFSINNIDWNKVDGLIPAIVQDAETLRVLMLGYMNAEALKTTLDTGHVTFFSRTKQRLWTKGETSGHFLDLVSIEIDCDNDTFLIRAIPHGPTCHNGTTTCFGEDNKASLSVLGDLTRTIKERRQNPQDSSYTNKLLAAGLSRMAQKVGEEGVETALAGATRADNLASESADLLYHLLVLLEASDCGLAPVLEILKQRAKPKDKP